MAVVSWVRNVVRGGGLTSTVGPRFCPRGPATDILQLKSLGEVKEVTSVRYDRKQRTRGREASVEGDVAPGVHAASRETLEAQASPPSSSCSVQQKKALTLKSDQVRCTRNHCAGCHCKLSNGYLVTNHAALSRCPKQNAVVWEPLSTRHLRYSIEPASVALPRIILEATTFSLSHFSALQKASS